MNTTQKKALLGRCARTTKKLEEISGLIVRYQTLAQELDALISGNKVRIQVGDLKHGTEIKSVSDTDMTEFLFERITRQILQLEETLRQKGVIIQALIPNQLDEAESGVD